jgi:hypothetical protein
LATSVWKHPHLQEQAIALVNAIVEHHGSDGLALQSARIVAEAEVELERIRAMRAQVLSTALAAEGARFHQLQQLQTFHRYERRALSKRRFAIRALAR